jgi:hypothetical protein
MKTLAELNQKYEDIFHNLAEPKKSKALADLMTEIESLYGVPMLRNPDGKRKIGLLLPYIVKFQ